MWSASWSLIMIVYLYYWCIFFLGNARPNHSYNSCFSLQNFVHLYLFSHNFSFNSIAISDLSYKTYLNIRAMPNSEVFQIITHKYQCVDTILHLRIQVHGRTQELLSICWIVLSVNYSKREKYNKVMLCASCWQYKQLKGNKVQARIIQECSWTHGTSTQGKERI